MPASPYDPPDLPPEVTAGVTDIDATWANTVHDWMEWHGVGPNASVIHTVQQSIASSASSSRASWIVRTSPETPVANAILSSDTTDGFGTSLSPTASQFSPPWASLWMVTAAANWGIAYTAGGHVFIGIEVNGQIVARSSLSVDNFRIGGVESRIVANVLASPTSPVSVHVAQVSPTNAPVGCTVGARFEYLRQA